MVCSTPNCGLEFKPKSLWNKLCPRCKAKDKPGAAIRVIVQGRPTRPKPKKNQSSGG